MEKKVKGYTKSDGTKVKGYTRKVTKKATVKWAGQSRSEKARSKRFHEYFWANAEAYANMPKSNRKPGSKNGGN